MSLSVITTSALILAGLVVLRKIREQFWAKCKSKIRMENKTVLITGANSGIGKATAQELANLGARVILACRDLSKAEKAVKDIRKRTKKGVLKICELDLASFSSIKRFCEDFLNTESRLDILINNAGIFQCPFARTVEGFEMQFGVNHLGHFLLTNLLLDRIKQSQPSRIIVVSSILYKKGAIDFNLVNSHSRYDKRKAYSNSKLANVLFSNELAKRLSGTQVSVNAVSPGIVWTNLGRHIEGRWYKMILLAPFAWFMVQTPSQGCQTILHCAIDPELEGETGNFYRNCMKIEMSDTAKDRELSQKLWDYSENCIKNV